MLLFRSDIDKLKWMLILFKLDRVILVKGNVEYDAVEKIFRVIDDQNRIKKTNLIQEYTYDRQISRVLNSEHVKAFLEQFRPMKKQVNKYLSMNFKIMRLCCVTE